MTYKVCPFCKGAKHVIKNGSWERCLCLKKENLERNLIYGGITLGLNELSLANLPHRFPHVKLNEKSLEIVEAMDRIFKKGVTPEKLFCFQGSQNGCLDVIVQTILKSAIEVDKTVRQITLQNIITSHFKDNEFDMDNVFNCDILSVYFGGEIQYNIASNILKELIRNAWIKQTYLLLTTALTFDAVGEQYGGDVQRCFLRSGIDPVYDNEKRVIFMRLEI